MKKIVALLPFAIALSLFSTGSSFGQGVPFPEVKTPTPASVGPAFGPLDTPSASNPPRPPQPSPSPPQPKTAAPSAGMPINHPPHALAQTPAYRQPERRQPDGRRHTSEGLESVIDRNHPFAFYYEAPKDPRSMIKGKPYRVARLLEGTRNVTTRKNLLKNYWELAGLLVEYNTRIDAERHLFQWLGESGKDPQRRNPMNLAFQLAQQQRKSVEIEFAKSQWKLASQLRQAKGETFKDEELPIPCDFPLYKKYETYAEKIARSDRARYFGRLIPCQEELISTKMVACSAADELLKSQPKNAAANGRDMISALNQRTDVFLELVDSVVEYNGMIAEYTSETVGPGVSTYRLVGALIELPNFVPHKSEQPEQVPPQQLAAPISSHFGYQQPAPGPRGDESQRVGLPHPESGLPRYAAREPGGPKPTFAPEPPSAFGDHPSDLTELPVPSPTPAPTEATPARPEIQPVSHIEEKQEKRPAPFQSIAPPLAP